MSKSKRAKEYAKTIKEGVDMTNKRFVIEVDRKTEMIVSQECYPDYVYNQLVTVASLAEQDAEERAVKAFCIRCRQISERTDALTSCQEDLPDSEKSKCWALNGFKQLLNGGQSDECNE